MPEGFKKVQAGDDLRISANAWNSFLDVAADFEAKKLSLGGKAIPSNRDADMVTIQNDTGHGLPRFSILGVDKPIFLPTESGELEFQSRVSLVCKTPRVEKHVGRFVVLAEPVPEEELGRAWASGVCQVRINVTDEFHQFADVAAGLQGTTDHLDSAGSGAAQILWKVPGTGVRWAVIRFGGSGGGSGVQWVFAIGLGSELEFEPKPGTIVYKVGIRSVFGLFVDWSVAFDFEPDPKDPDAEPPEPLTAPYPSGYTDDHFAEFFIGSRQPNASDHMCIVQGGFITPDWRMLIRTPSSIAGACD